MGNARVGFHFFMKKSTLINIAYALVTALVIFLCYRYSFHHVITELGIPFEILPVSALVIALSVILFKLSRRFHKCEGIIWLAPLLSGAFIVAMSACRLVFTIDPDTPESALGIAPAIQALMIFLAIGVIGCAGMLAYKKIKENSKEL